MVESSRFLGVVINSFLNWNDHISLVNSTISKTIGILRYVKNKLPGNILRTLYFTLVNPYYEYCNIVWAVKNTVLLQKLFISPKKVIRIITNSPWGAHTHPLFRRLSILKIEEIHKFQVACLCIRFIKV